MTGHFCQFCSMFNNVIGEQLEIISQIVRLYENSFHIDWSVRKVK